MFTIYSIGDSAYLTQILNAVAAIAGTGNWKTMASIGFLLGLLVMIYQMMSSGGKQGGFHTIIVAFVVYFLMFGTGVRVTIEDAYDGTIRTVDNVPIGVAAVGSVLSNIGYGTTKLFEQGFSTPKMTDYGFAGTLTILMRVWKTTQNRVIMEEANSPQPGMNVEETFTNYIKECTLVGVDLGQKTIPDILAFPEPMGAIRWDSNIYTTAIYPAGGERIMTCTDAWQQMNQDATNILKPVLADLLAARLNIAPVDVWTTIQDAVDRLGVAASNGIYLGGAMLMARRIQEGVVAKHEDDHAWTRAAMMQQAFMQRNAQWAAQESMFASIVRPMMTFFEGLVYAITPIMAFVITLGPMGISLVGKYLQMLLWIQLWMPILAIINLFINMTVAGEMQMFAGAGGAGGISELSSITGVMTLADTMQHWLGVGGMLASATPAISLMLIYGGAVAATHLAGRLQGGDHINEKTVAPDIVSPAPMLDMGSRYTNNPAEGTVQNGLSQELPTFDLSAMGSSMVSSARTRAETANAQLGNSLSKGYAESAQANNSTTADYGMNYNFGASRSETDSWLMKNGTDLSQRITGSTSRSNDFAGLLSGTMAASLGGTPLAGIRGDVQGKLQSQFGIKNQEQLDSATNAVMGFATDKKNQAAFTESVQRSRAAKQSSVYTSGASDTTSAQVQRSATNAQQRGREYKEADNWQQSNGWKSSAGTAATAKGVVASGNFNTLMATLDRHNLTGTAQELAQSMQASGQFTNGTQAMAAAGLMVMSGYHQSSSNRDLGDLAPAQNLDAQRSAMRIIHGSRSGGNGWQGTGKAQENHRIAEGAGQPGGDGVPSAQSTAALVDKHGSRASETVQAAKAGAADTRREAGGGESAVRAQHGAYYSEASSRGGNDAMVAGIQIANQAMDTIRNADYGRFDGAVATTTNGARNLMEFAGRMADQAGGAMQGFVQAFDNARNAGLSFPAAFQSAMHGSQEGYEQAASAYLDAKYTEAKGMGVSDEAAQAYRDAAAQSIGYTDGAHAGINGTGHNAQLPGNSLSSAAFVPGNQQSFDAAAQDLANTYHFNQRYGDYGTEVMSWIAAAAYEGTPESLITVAQLEQGLALQNGAPSPGSGAVGDGSRNDPLTIVITP